MKDVYKLLGSLNINVDDSQIYITLLQEFSRKRKLLEGETNLRYAASYALRKNLET